MPTINSMAQRRNPYAGADAHTRRAKAAGFPARSVFKLQEIDERLKLLRPGDNVLDLGAAPGSWSLYVAQRVGPRGRVLAIDLQILSQQFPANVTVLQADALGEAPPLLLERAPYRVVLSDMAPSTTGSAALDQARSSELCQQALHVAEQCLLPGGHFVAKLFMSADFVLIKSRIQGGFEHCRTLRPEATRSNSSEVFLVGLGRLCPR